MNLLENVGTYLISISSVCAVVVILICIAKIMTTDEGENRIYIKRIKNVIIALVCIVSVVQLRNLTLKYFKANDLGIGTIDSSQTGQKGSLFSVEEKDKNDRKVLQQYEYGGTKYTLVLQDSCSTRDVVELNRKGLKTLYAWKLFSDCQGMTSGSLARVYFYSFTDDLSKLEKKVLPLYYCGDDNNKNPSSICFDLGATALTESLEKERINKINKILKDHGIDPN